MLIRREGMRAVRQDASTGNRPTAGEYRLARKVSDRTAITLPYTVCGRENFHKPAEMRDRALERGGELYPDDDGDDDFSPRDMLGAVGGSSVDSDENLAASAHARGSKI